MCWAAVPSDSTGDFAGEPTTSAGSYARISASWAEYGNTPHFYFPLTFKSLMIIWGVAEPLNQLRLTV
jgi:hypothetical protein